MTWYENFLGTFCETIIIMSILQLFSDGYNRHKKEVLLCICIISCMDTVCYSMGEGYYWLEFMANNVLLLGWIKWISKQKWISCLFQFAVGVLFVTFSEALLIEISSLVNIRASISTPVRFVHLASLCLISYYLGSRPVLQKSWRLYYEKWSQILHFILGNLLVVALMELYLWNSKNHVYYQEPGLIFMVLVLWVGLNMFLLKSLLDNQKKKEQLLMHTSYIDMIEALLDELHEEKHEFRKHLQTLEGFSYESQPQEAICLVREYLQNLKLVANREDKGHKATGYLTGNRAVNALLHMKDKEAQEREVTFLYMPSNPFPTFPCQEYKLIELVGNLINNAFEYVQALPVENRRVVLQLVQQRTESYIEVSNPLVQNEGVFLDKVSLKGYSTKNGGKRGYGLHRVRLIAEKYHGKLSITQQGDSFVAAVYFNNSSGQSGSP